MCQGSFESSEEMPWLLPCLYVICDKCVVELDGTDERPLPPFVFLCPSCSSVHAIEDLCNLSCPIDIWGILLNKNSKTVVDTVPPVPKCENCPENVGSGFCQECKMYLCDECCNEHKYGKYKRFHSHIITVADKSLEDNHNNGSDSSNKHKWLCEKHPSEKLKWFCQPCQKLLCNDCVLSKVEGHTDHERKNINEASEDFHKVLSHTISLVQERAGPLRNILQEHQVALQDIDKHSLRSIQAVQECFGLIREALAKRETELIQLIEVLCVNKKDNVQDRVNSIARPLHSAEVAIAFGKLILQSPGVEEICLQLQPSVYTRLNQLLHALSIETAAASGLSSTDDVGDGDHTTAEEGARDRTRAEISPYFSVTIASRPILSLVEKLGHVHDFAVYPASCLLQGEMFGGTLVPGTDEVLCDAGKGLSFSIISCREDGRFVNKGGLQVDVSLLSLMDSVRIPVVDREDGTYYVSYPFSVHSCARYHLDVKVLGYDVCGSPVRLQVVDSPDLVDGCLLFAEPSGREVSVHYWELKKTSDGPSSCACTMCLPEDKRSYWTVRVSGTFQSPNRVMIGIKDTLNLPMKYSASTITSGGGISSVSPHDASKTTSSATLKAMSTGAGYWTSSATDSCFVGWSSEGSSEWPGFVAGDEMLFCYDPISSFSQRTLSVLVRNKESRFVLQVPRGEFKVYVDVVHTSSCTTVVTLGQATLNDVDVFVSNTRVKGC